MKPDPTIWRTPNLICPACEERRVHQAGERALYHPFSGHGYTSGRWTHQALEPAFDYPAAPAAKGAA